MPEVEPENNAYQPETVLGPVSDTIKRYAWQEVCRRGMSRSYVVKNTASLNNKGWIETIDEDNPLGYRYRLRHHLCDPEEVPVDRDGKPLKFAVPRGTGGPLERCFDGDISWKATLAWISLKLRSNWKASEDTAGQTESATLLELSKRIRISLRNYQNLITELTQAGMLERLTPKSQAAIFQLYPMPFPRSLMPRGANPTRNVGQRQSIENRWRLLVFRQQAIPVPVGETSPSKDGNAAAHGNGFRDIINIRRCLKQFSVILSVLLSKRLVESAVFS